jgi:hypothetical protein
MFKKVLLSAVLVAGFVCSGDSSVRIDIRGEAGKVEMAPGEASKGLEVVNPSWAKDLKKFALSVYSSLKLTDKWQKFSFSFTPQDDGMVKIHFKGLYRKVKGSNKNIVSWTAYDNITVAGTEAKNCDFEFVNQKNLFDGWAGNPANMVTGVEDAKSGKNYVIVWHDSPVIQTLKLKKGEKVTITFFAKASEGPVKKRTSDNI